MTQEAQIVGKVEYREGDGQPIEIPIGPIEVETTITDATLSWIDGDTHGSAAIPIGDFQRYVARGTIEMKH